MRNNNPQNYEPTREEVLEAMQELSKYFSPKSVLRSSDYSDLEITGQRESNDKQDSKKTNISQPVNDFL